jgi:hypothetical protein
VSEVAQAFAFIDSTMRADSALMAAATGGVWQGIAEIGVLPPFVIYGQQANSDITTMTKTRLWASILMQVKAMGPVKPNYAALVTIADRIDALFKSVRYVGLPGGGGVLECYRDGSIALDEVVNGVQWSQLGGLYRIDLQGS